MLRRNHEFPRVQQGDIRRRRPQINRPGQDPRDQPGDSIRKIPNPLLRWTRSHTLARRHARTLFLSTQKTSAPSDANHPVRVRAMARI
jgi:hypothetical protein